MILVFVFFDSVGSGPFCGADPSQCDMPGYYYGDEHTSGCWTGKKARCKFSKENFKKSGYFRDLEMSDGTEFANKYIPSNFTVYGTAPLCGVIICTNITF